MSYWNDIWQQCTGVILTSNKKFLAQNWIFEICRQKFAKILHFIDFVIKDRRLYNVKAVSPFTDPDWSTFTGRKIVKIDEDPLK